MQWFDRTNLTVSYTCCMQCFTFQQFKPIQLLLFMWQLQEFSIMTCCMNTRDSSWPVGWLDLPCCFCIFLRLTQVRKCVMLLTRPLCVIRYVRQFREIFTEEGRRQVKITHTLPGRQPVVSFTQVLSGIASSTPGTSGSTSTVSQNNSSVTAPSQVAFLLTALCYFFDNLDFFWLSSVAMNIVYLFVLAVVNYDWILLWWKNRIIVDLQLTHGP